MIKLLAGLLLVVLLNERATADNHYDKVVKEIFASLGKDPEARLNSIYAEADQLLGASRERVEECYENTISGEVVDIFKESLGLIVRKYLVI